MERVRVPRQRRAFSVQGGSIEQGGDPEASRLLAAGFEADPALDRALTHGFHSYAGRMHPGMARGVLRAFSPAAGRVLDPFCGSGTVLVEALTQGRAAVGLDASPLAVAIATVRSAPLGPESRERLVARAAEIAEGAEDRARKRQRPQIPIWARDEHKRFSPHVALELLGLRELVMATPDDAIGRALRMCFSSILVKFMRSGPEAPRDAATKRIGRGIPSRFFAARANELAAGLATLERQIPAGTPPVEVRLGDARAYPELPAASFDLVLSSPPYAGTYDYAEHHVARFTWLGLKQAAFEKRQLGSRDRGLGTSPREWNDGRRRWLAEIGRVLKPGGAAVLAVGDGVVGDRPEDAGRAVADAAAGAGLGYQARASQLRPIHDRRLREIFDRADRYEHLVLLRKT